MVKIELGSNFGVEGPNIKELSVKDWREEGIRLFGTSISKDWKWKCSNCGHVQTIADFIELRDLGILPAGTDVGQLVYFSCIGRFDTRIPKEKVGTVWDKKSPCNYTLGGLFVFTDIFVISETGKRIPVFDFVRDDVKNDTEQNHK